MDHPTRTPQSNPRVVPTPQRDYEKSPRVVLQRRSTAISQV